MKVLKKSFLRQNKQIEHTWAERQILEKVNHPFIVKLKFAFQTAKKLFLILDYCAGGELFFYLQKLGRFKERTAQFYAANILLALEYLHNHGVIYRDLKPENILVSKEGYAKLTDFGLSKREMSGGKLTHSICGTKEYIAPEVYMGKGYSFSCDWWSYGCLLFEMIEGLPPFYCQDTDELFDSILKKDPKYQSQISPVAKDLITKLLAKNPKRRLCNPTEIKKHQFFTGIDWDKLEL